MRVYLPSTLPALRRSLDRGAVEVVGGTGFAVTDALRREYPDWSDEDLEYLAMKDAARASLRLVAAGSGPPLRVVISTDVPDVQVRDRSDADRAAVTIETGPGWRQVAAVHLDGADATAAVAIAAAAVDAADLGDDDAEFAVSEAEEYALAWFATGEIRYLLDELGEPGPA